MKRFDILMFLLVIQLPVLHAQCKDVTQIVRDIFKNKEVQSYGLIVVGACVDDLKTLHITTRLDYLYSQALLDFGFGPERTVVVQTMEPFFTSVRKFYRAFPEISNVRLYIVEFEEMRDDYGNETERKKKILSMMGMTKTTLQKINWSYLDDGSNLKNLLGFGDYSKLYKMLDEALIKGVRFR